VVKDLRGVIHSWNPGAERLFGYAAAEVIGKPVTVLIPPDREEEETYILRLIGHGEKLDHYRTVRCRKDGTLVDISLSVTPIRDDHGQVIGAAKLARDVSEIRRAEQQREQLAQAQQRLSAIVEATGDAVLSTTLEGLVQTWNKGAEHLFGHAAADAIGKPAAELIAAERGNDAVDLLRRAAAGERIEHFATSRRRPDGAAARIALSLSPIREPAGAVVGILIIGRGAEPAKPA